ncbi:unknown [Clostridium sp. CAG:354]|nr:NUDIX hydrolase [Clostridium sp.]CDE11045.1 unknown [Clostridium sp. CAG:354]
MDEHELITEAAIRESYEETGCKVNLTGVLPISCVDFEDGKIYQLDIFNNIKYIR